LLDRFPEVNKTEEERTVARETNRIARQISRSRSKEERTAGNQKSVSSQEENKTFASEEEPPATRVENCVLYVSSFTDDEATVLQDTVSYEECSICSQIEKEHASKDLQIEREQETISQQDESYQECLACAQIEQEQGSSHSCS
jgi:hypothetical protein